MNKKLKERIEFWDIKSFVLTIIVFGIFLFLFFFLTGIRDRFRSHVESDYTKNAYVVIISVEQKDKMIQGLDGSRIEIDQYKVCYHYVVNGMKYNGVDYVPNTLKNRSLIKKLLKRKQNDIFVVRYNEEHPQTKHS